MKGITPLVRMLAKTAGVSPELMLKVITVGREDKDLYRKIESGEISAAKAYKIIQDRGKSEDELYLESEIDKMEKFIRKQMKQNRVELFDAWMSREEVDGSDLSLSLGPRDLFNIT